jgi:hypothetical protein
VRDGGEPHTPQSLARISRLPAALFEEAIPRLLKIGWIEKMASNIKELHEGAEIPQVGATLPQDAAEIPQDGASSRAGAVRNGTEGNGTEPNGNAGGFVAIPPASKTAKPDWMHPEFNRLAGEYPNASGVELARQLWIGYVFDGVITDPADVFAGLKRWKESSQWTRDGGQYIPGLDKWLSGKRWRDTPTPYVAPSGGGSRVQGVREDARRIMQERKGAA